jgi:hypothetical protein
MSLTRDTDLAQRTVALFGGAREGEPFLFGVLIALPDQEVRRWKCFMHGAAD